VRPHKVMLIVLHICMHMYRFVCMVVLVVICCNSPDNLYDFNLITIYYDVQCSYIMLGVHVETKSFHF